MWGDPSEQRQELTRSPRLPPGITPHGCFALEQATVTAKSSFIFQNPQDSLMGQKCVAGAAFSLETCWAGQVLPAKRLGWVGECAAFFHFGTLIRHPPLPHSLSRREATTVPGSHHCPSSSQLLLLGQNICGAGSSMERKFTPQCAGLNATQLVRNGADDSHTPAPADWAGRRSMTPNPPGTPVLMIHHLCWYRCGKLACIMLQAGALVGGQSV